MPAGAPLFGGLISSLGSSIGSSIADAILNGLGNWVDSGAIWLIDQVGAFMGSTTQADLGSSWFGTRLTLMSELAAAVILPMLLCAVIQAIYRQSAASLLRIFLVNLPIALLMTGVAVELVRIGMAVTDQMSSQFLSAGGVDTRQFLAPLTTDLSIPALGLPSFAAFFIGLFIASAALAIWLELVVRSAAISAAALFLPLVLAALVWPAISHWARRLADTLAALVLSKLVIAAIISLAAGALDAGANGTGSASENFGQIIDGLALLLLSAFSPFVLLRLVPLFEAGAVMHLEGAGTRLKASAHEAIRPATTAAQMLLKPPGSQGLGAVPLSAIGTGAAEAADGSDEMGNPLRGGILGHGNTSPATGSAAVGRSGRMSPGSSESGDNSASGGSGTRGGSASSGGRGGRTASTGASSKGSRLSGIPSTGSDESGAGERASAARAGAVAAEQMKDWFPELSEHLANGTLPETGPGIPSETAPGLILPSMEMIQREVDNSAPRGWTFHKGTDEIESNFTGLTVPPAVWRSPDFDPFNHDSYDGKGQSPNG